MAKEALAQITEAEQQGKEIKASAREQANRMKEKAAIDAAALVAKRRQDAEEQAKALMTKAEAQAQDILAKAREDAANGAETLRASIEKKVLDAASRLLSQL